MENHRILPTLVSGDAEDRIYAWEPNHRLSEEDITYAHVEYFCGISPSDTELYAEGSRMYFKLKK